jgi:site-specific recombinase XerD
MSKRICFLYTETNGLHKTTEDITKKNLFNFIAKKDPSLNRLKDIAKNIELPKIGQRLYKSLDFKQIESVIKAIENKELDLLKMIVNINFDDFTTSKIISQHQNPEIAYKKINDFVLKNISAVNKKHYTTLWQLKRTKALVYLIYATGMRISEVLNLKSNQVSKSDGFVRVLGKGQKERIIPLINNVFTYIEEYIRFCPYAISYETILFFGQNGKPYLPRMFQREIELLRKNLSLPKWFTPHSLRHCFATHLIEAGSDIKVVQELLGHKDLTSTQIYTKIDKNQIKISQKHLANF